MRGFIFGIILFGIFALLLGCGVDQYAIEKEYWKTQKEAKKIFKNPLASPPNELERVVKLLDSFGKKYPQNNLSIDADFTIARLYIVKKEYDKTRAQLKALLDKYSKSEDICAEVVFLTGNSYEIEDKWNLALEQYKKIIQMYPTTLRGLSIPIYIVQYYKAKYQPDKMVAALGEAVSHYKALANKYPDSPLGFRAYSLVAECYIGLKDWQNTVNTLNTIIDNYKNRVEVDGILMDLALVYNRELKDKTKAKETLERLVREYPKSRLTKTAIAILKEMEKKNE